MRFRYTAIAGLMVLEPEPARDERGAFSRLFCRREFVAHGLNPHLEQCSLSHTLRRGTVRGLHYQVAPFAEDKLVGCVGGSAFDVVVDLRAGSATFGRHVAVELEAASGVQVYVPAGCAHGFQTLADDTSLLYMISAPYDAASARGLRWNDPALGIAWPIPEAAVVSPRDHSLPLLAEVEPCVS